MSSSECHDQKWSSHPSVPVSTLSHVFSAAAGRTKITRDGRIAGDGLWWSGWMLAASLSSGAAAGDSQSESSLVDVQNSLLDMLNTLGRKLNTHTHITES